MVGHLLLLALLTSSTPDAAARAEAYTRRAMTEFDGGELDDALVDAKKAYALSPVPGLLYNLGQIHRALHHWEEAAHAFRAYLRNRPDAPNRASIEKLITQMEQAQRDQQSAQRAPAAPPVLVVPQTPAASPAPAPAPRPRSARAAEKRRLVVLDVQARFGVSPELTAALSDAVVVEVRRHNPAAVVVGADEVRAMIGLEKQKSLLGCTETSCLAEIGGAMGAREVVMGSLARFGNAYLLGLKLVDTRAGHVSASASERVEAGHDELLLDEVGKAVAQLFPDTIVPAPAPAVAADAFAEPPAATAGESHGHALAWTLLGTGLAAAAVGFFGLAQVLDYSSANAAYQNAKTYQSYETAQAAGNTANVWGPVAIGCAVGAALLGAGTAIAW